jgi:hypothetical protein
LTLVELAIAIGLTGILGIPTGLVVGDLLFGTLHARDAMVALQLARAEMERLDSFDDFFHADLTPPRTTVLPNYLGLAYDVTRTVSCQPSAGNCASPDPAIRAIKRIELTVTKTGQTDALARLVSYRTKGVRFGQ